MHITELSDGSFSIREQGCGCCADSKLWPEERCGYEVITREEVVLLKTYFHRQLKLLSVIETQMEKGQS